MARKQRKWAGLDLTVVAPSRWMAERARQSQLFRDVPVEVIANGLDINLFRSSGRSEARARLGLPVDYRLVALGSWMTTQWKGVALLPALLEELAANSGAAALGIITFGRSLDIPSKFPVYHQGVVDDEGLLADVYAAADVFVSLSSVESLGYTIMEALACGTPCVAFDVGGIADLVDHKENGYLATPFDVKDIVRGIKFVMDEPLRHQLLSSRARQKIEQGFSHINQAQKYSELFEAVLSRGHDRWQPS